MNIINLEIYAHVINPYLIKAEEEVLTALNIKASVRGTSGRDGSAIHITDDLFNDDKAEMMCTCIEIGHEDLERNNIDKHFKDIGKVFLDQFKFYNIKEISEIAVTSGQNMGMLKLTWYIWFKYRGEKK